MKQPQVAAINAKSMSVGIWKKRVDIEKLLDVRLVHPFVWTPNIGVYVGWGAKKSGELARSKAILTGRKVTILEDGFLKGYSNKLDEPVHSYVVDNTGIYFDTRSNNDFEIALASQNLNTNDISKTEDLIARVRSEKITKFNNWPTSAGTSEVSINSPFLLLVDQVEHDASIAGASATSATFEQMLIAAEADANGRKIVLRVHPAALATSPLVSAAKRLKIPVIIPAAINPWQLLEQADAVYTISSQLGFEALMCDKPVICFGKNFYAARGITDDRFESAKDTKAATLIELFHAFHRSYARYLDIHTRERCDMETALDQAIFIRNQRGRVQGQVFTGGLSPWKRHAVAPFLIGANGPAKHKLTIKKAQKSATKQKGTVAVWGTGNFETNTPNMLYLEDGFVRSVGLGAKLAFPYSLALDRVAPHFVASQNNELLQLLNTLEYSPSLYLRAQNLRKRLVEAQITKYNSNKSVQLPNVEQGRLKILVPGQVEADASIRYGASTIKTNYALVEKVRSLFPEAFIAYKIHPDVVAGVRSGGLTPIAQDLTIKEGGADAWIHWCDRVETITSLTGFEALIRGKSVGVHGSPAYAGWGLTTDYSDIKMRNRTLTIDQLIAGMLIVYPFYIHPISRLPIMVEGLIDILSDKRQNKLGKLNYIWRLFGGINKATVKWRDWQRNNLNK